MTDPQVFGDTENATNTDPEKTADVDQNPADTVSGGTPEPAGDDDE
jgi:hypothetical protein